jgi:WD40 repeat protein
MVRKAKFNADDTWVLTYSADGTARLWHAETGKPIGKKMVHEKAVNGATFNVDETRILTWSGNILEGNRTTQLWDISVDWDYPIDKIKLQIMALTGTKFNTTTMEIEVIEPDEWRKTMKEYMEFAVEHYKTCKYPHANVFRKLFMED